MQQDDNEGFEFDWFIHFFEASSRISNEHMQGLWAKLFLEIVGVAMQTIEGMWFVLGEGPSSFNLDEVQDLIISNNKIRRMQECGLLNPIKDNILVWYNIEKISSPIRISDSFALMNRTTLLLFHSSERGKTRVQKKIDKEKVTFFPYYPLTETGRQLLSIVQTQEKYNYILELGYAINDHKRAKTKRLVTAHTIECICDDKIYFVDSDLLDYN